MVKVRDGVRLCTDVFLPESDEPGPTVVVRTPYGRNTPFLLAMARHLNLAGFGLLLQDSRGRYQSGGVYDWQLEEGDGYDTLLWLGRQPWSDGRVALMGMSISAHPNFLLAAGEWPQGITIEAMVSVMGAIDYHAMFYRGGALVLHWALPWSSVVMGTGGPGRRGLRGRAWDQIYGHLPLAELPPAEQLDTWLWKWVLSNPSHSGGWDRFNALPRLADLEVPTLHLSGWRDFMLGHTLRAWECLAGDDTPAHQKLVVGPWDHQNIFASFAGPSTAGRQAGAPNLRQIVLSWFERWLGEGPAASPRDEASRRQPKVLLHLDRANAWLGADRFPLPETEIMLWYLTSAGRAGTAEEDGRLVRQRPRRPGQDTFSYDPHNPVPTRGGAVWPFKVAGLDPGLADQSELEQRHDILLYSSEPLDQDVVVAGHLRVELWAASSARDTDFTAKLVDVDPRGSARIVSDGIIRGRFHRSLRRQQLLQPHHPYRFEIELQAVCYCFRRGHRLRLEISSSNFPKFDRNLNTASDLFSSPVCVVAQQTVFHGGEMGSSLRLPVVPASRVAARTLTDSAAAPDSRAR